MGAHSESKECMLLLDLKTVCYLTQEIPQRLHTCETFSSSSISFHCPHFKILEEVRCAVIILESLLLSFVQFCSSSATICMINCIGHKRNSVVDLVERSGQVKLLLLFLLVI